MTDLEQNLRDDGLEPMQLSIAPQNAEQIWATVTFAGGSSSSLRPDLLGKYKTDDHFLDFTVLVDNGETTVDIVALTGLGGHALGLYKSPESNGMWLCDWLDIPAARVVLYGYETILLNSISHASLGGLGKDLPLGPVCNSRRELRSTSTTDLHCT